jgi:hypothetical protein
MPQSIIRRLLEQRPDALITEQLVVLDRLTHIDPMLSRQMGVDCSGVEQNVRSKVSDIQKQRDYLLFYILIASFHHSEYGKTLFEHESPLTSDRCLKELEQYRKQVTTGHDLPLCCVYPWTGSNIMPIRCASISVWMNYLTNTFTTW